MADTMYIERKQDLSVVYFLKDIFDGVATVVDAFPGSDLEIPTVSVEWAEIEVYWYQLGDRDGADRRVWIIDVFADNKSRRDDFAYRIKNELKYGVPVYNYDEGFPPDVSPTKIGLLKPTSISMNTVAVNPELVSKLYWRTNIRFVTTYENC